MKLYFRVSFFYPYEQELQRGGCTPVRSDQTASASRLPLGLEWRHLTAGDGSRVVPVYTTWVSKTPSPRLQKTNNLEDPAECWLPSLYHHTNLSKSFCSGLAVSTLSKMLLPAECKTEGNGSSYCWIQITRPTDAFQVSTTTTKQTACSCGWCWFVLR
jgi:hypothetical protein